MDLIWTNTQVRFKYKSMTFCHFSKPGTIFIHPSISYHHLIRPQVTGYHFQMQFNAHKVYEYEYTLTRGVCCVGVGVVVV